MLLAAFTSSGINFDNGKTLILVVLLLSLFNLILKPVLILFALPFIIFTMGFGLWIINALLLLLVSELVSGFYVNSFPTALWGSFVVSMTSLISNIFLSKNVKIKRSSSRRFRQKNEGDDEIIDI